MSIVKLYKHFKKKYNHSIILFELEDKMEVVNDDAFFLSKIVNNKNAMVVQKTSYYSFTFPKGDLEKYRDLVINIGKSIAVVTRLYSEQEKGLFNI